MLDGSSKRYVAVTKRFSHYLDSALVRILGVTKNHKILGAKYSDWDSKFIHYRHHTSFFIIHFRFIGSQLGFLRNLSKN